MHFSRLFLFPIITVISATALAQSVEPLPEQNYQVRQVLKQTASSTKESRQGAAAFDGILFQFHNSNDVVDVYEIATGRKLQEIKLTRYAENHCNNVNFSSQKFSRKDRFPLLYVSTERANATFVYRVIEQDGQFSLLKIQTIHLPLPETMGLYFPNCIIDSKSNSYWLSGYSQNSWKSPANNNHLRYIRFRLPDFRKGDATIQIADALQEFTAQWVYATQGVFIKGKRIYHSSGIEKDNILLRVINTKTGRIEKAYHPFAKGITSEPEGAFLLNGHPTIACQNGHVYQIIAQ